jgi:NitT/TauT family transport system ATP-binding protein
VASSTSQVVQDVELGGEPLLEAVDICKSYPLNGSVHQVLEGTRFTVRQGELTCVTGRSGCGKTTLLKILAGLTSPSSGTVLLEGSPVSGPGPDRCVVFQEYALFPWLTVEENIAFGLKIRRVEKSTAKEAVDRYLVLMGLSQFKDYLPREISGGMKQRVALARVLILNPKILLMDEPFGALDAQTREDMQSLLLELWEELHHTILFVTHNVNEALLLADRVLIMGINPGRIIKEISVDLPRPRAREEREFLLMGQELRAALRS